MCGAGLQPPLVSGAIPKIYLSRPWLFVPSIQVGSIRAHRVRTFGTCLKGAGVVRRSFRRIFMCRITVYAMRMGVGATEAVEAVCGLVEPLGSHLTWTVVVREGFRRVGTCRDTSNVWE